MKETERAILQLENKYNNNLNTQENNALRGKKLEGEVEKIETNTDTIIDGNVLNNEKKKNIIEEKEVQAPGKENTTENHFKKTIKINDFDNKKNPGYAEYGTCLFHFFRTLEYIIYPFISYMVTLIGEILFGAFYITFGAIAIEVICLGFLILLIKFVCVLIISSNDIRFSEQVSSLSEYMFQAFSNLFWGIALIFIALGDSIVSIIDNIKSIKNRDIAVNHPISQNFGVMWKCTLQFARNHGLLSVKIRKPKNEEEEKKNKEESNK